MEDATSGTMLEDKRTFGKWAWHAPSGSEAPPEAGLPRGTAACQNRHIQRIAQAFIKFFILKQRRIIFKPYKFRRLEHVEVRQAVIHRHDDGIQAERQKPMIQGSANKIPAAV